MNKRYLNIILEIIGILLFGTTILLYALPFVSYVLDSGSVSGFQFMFENSKYCKTDNGYVWIFTTFIVSVAFFITLVVAFIYECLNQSNNQEDKEKHRMLIISITSFFVLIIIIFVCVINLSVLNICGYNGKEISGFVYLGSGAISTSVLFSLGMIIIEILMILNYCKINQSVKVKTSNNDQPINFATIEEELTKLKSLKDKGLITDEDYMKKKNQILGL